MKTVLTYGTFDLFHIGHLNLLERAATYGDRLIVALSTDDFNSKMKGKITTFPYEDRKRILEALSIVDLVIPESNWGQKEYDVKEYDVDIFLMGHDWQGEFDYLSSLCEVKYLPRTENISSTKIKKHIKSDIKTQVFANALK